MRKWRMTIYPGFLLRLDISGHMIGPRLHQLHFFFAHIVASSSLYMGTVTTLLYFKTLTGFPVCKSISALTTFTVNNIRRLGENCWEGKPFADIEGMLGILPGGGITTFWFGVYIALFLHGCPNTRKESSSSKPWKLNPPSCGNSVRIPRYSLTYIDDGFN